MFLFNIGGYYLVFWGLRSHANTDLLRRLDADKYSTDDLVVLSIPMSLPYPNQETSYQRVDGKFEYKGEYYNLVKQRMENDTLFIVCIKNRQEKQLVNALNEYSDLANNLPSSAKHTLDLFGKLFKDYTIHTFSVTSYEGWCTQISYIALTWELATQSYPVPTPPPDYNS
ncbi:MAG: hypothetical protein ABIS36_22670 [Chryseolinea sp.]